MAKVNNDVIDTLKDRYLTFPMAEHTLALEVEFVNEILDVQDITFVPMVPSYLEGVINLRGKVVPMINFYKLFGIDESKYKTIRCMAIIEYKDNSIGVMVERVNEVLEITPDKIIKGSVNTLNAENAENAENAQADEGAAKVEPINLDELEGEERAIAEFVKAIAEYEESTCSIIDIDKLIALKK